MNEIIFGIHTVESILNSTYSIVKKIFILKKNKSFRLQNIVKHVKQKKIFFEFVDKKWLDQKSNNQIHQGILAYIVSKNIYKEHFLKNIIDMNQHPFFLVLDNIIDPHNLGACIRSADAFGVHAVIIPKNRSAKLTHIAKKSASGAAENIPVIQVTNLSRTLRFLKNENIFILGTIIDIPCKTFFISDMVTSIALVMGGEEKGIRQLTKKNCDALTTIPMHGTVASLNVSVATGILLFEILRKRQLIL